MFGRREKRMENGVGFYSFLPTKLNPSKLRGKYGWDRQLLFCPSFEKKKIASYIIGI